MAIKFDGTEVKDGWKTVGNLKRTDELKEGSSSGGKTIGNIKRSNEIREGSSSGGKKLISLSDAAKAIGYSSQGASTALVWWFFKR